MMDSCYDDCMFDEDIGLFGLDGNAYQFEPECTDEEMQELHCLVWKNVKYYCMLLLCEIWVPNLHWGKFDEFVEHL